MLNYTENLKRRKSMEKIKSMWDGLNKKGKIIVGGIGLIIVVVVLGNIF